MFFGTNVYGWTLLAKRDGHEYSLERAMAEAKAAGVRGWEGAFREVAEVQDAADAARKQGLEMHTAYVFGAFHEPDLAKEATSNALGIAEALRAVGVRNLIFNPDPLPGGAPKTDAQLLTQSAAINSLAKALAKDGSRLLYHSHDPEMKEGAREFHHMLVNTDPEVVGLCLDVHWVYRGAGYSQLALHDIITLYAKRINLIHLRQSSGQVWTESIGEGDLDFPALARHLEKNSVKSLLVIELAMEAGTPAALSGKEAHEQAIAYLEPLFASVGIEPPRNTHLPWRIFLYGAGAIAHHHAHTATNNLHNFELFAADPSQAARDEFVKTFPKVVIFESADEMLASTPAQENDFVIIAAPPWLHHTAALSGFKSGRHVLCEKPVTLSQAELDDLLAASRAAGRRFGDCSIRFLCNSGLAHARKLLSSGGIGSPYHARLVNRIPRLRPGIEFQPASRWFLNKEKAGGGVLFDWGVYDMAMFFDVLRPVAARVNHAWTTSPPTAVDPPEHPITIETHAGASITLTLESGAIVSFDYERAFGFHGERQSLLNVDGSDGGITWEWSPPFDDGTAKVTRYLDVDGKVEKRVDSFPSFGWDDVHGNPLLAFVDLLAGRETTSLPESRLEFNYGVLSAIYESAAKGVPVDVKLKL